MKIVHIISQLGVRDVTTLVTDLLPALEARGVQPELWYFGNVGDTERGEVEVSCPTRELGDRQGPFVRRVRNFAGHVHASDADIFHAHAPPAEVLVGLTYCGVCAIGHIHRAPPPELYDAPLFSRLGMVQRVIRPMTFCRLNLVIACSEAAREFATRAYGLPPDNQYVVRNAVDLQRVCRTGAGEKLQGASANGAVRFGFLGRLESVKNVSLLLNACHQMREDASGWNLTIIGDGPLRDELEELARRLDLSDQIRFRGESLNVMADLQNIDVLVHPSDSEGISISILEAMELGIPVNAARVGGNSECIVDGETGLLVPPGDEAALVEACRKLAADSGLRKRLGRGARRRVRSEFTIERLADELLDCYRRV